MLTKADIIKRFCKCRPEYKSKGKFDPLCRCDKMDTLLELYIRSVDHEYRKDIKSLMKQIKDSYQTCLRIKDKHVSCMKKGSI